MAKATIKAKKIGKVTHYFDHIGVAVLKLAAKLAVGDTVKFSGHGNEFTQTVSSMQLDHKAIETAKPKDDVAVKVDMPVKEGDEVEVV